MTYQNTQRSPIGYIFVVMTVGVAVLAWFIKPELSTKIALWSLAGVFFVISLVFQSLTILDTGQFLKVYFGYIPVIRKQIRYSDITEVEIAASSWIDGWGIHWIPGRGTTWNIWGFECVKLTVDGKTMRLGTNDAERLATFLQQRISSRFD